ncbi:BTB/POZ domain-containing protein [Phthorimaea operculella]|nr:BTB/POZ domain-containing protein [Phthorimaea operculella]
MRLRGNFGALTNQLAVLWCASNNSPFEHNERKQRETTSMSTAESMNVDTWQSECGEVRTRLTTILERGLWTDCELAVGSVGAAAVRVPAHRVLLASASPVLASMMYGPLPTPPDQPLPLPDVEPEIAQLLLKYIYTDNIVLSSCNDACNLYRAAHFLLISHLVAVCKEYLLNNVSAGIALRIYEFAQLFGENELMQKCMEAADRWAQQKQAKSEGQQPKTANQLKEDEQNKDEDLPIETVDARLLLRPLLQQIRFLAMDPDDFTQYDMSHLLSQSELLAISFNLLSNKSHLAMPPGFTTSREIRKIKNVIKMKVPYLSASIPNDFTKSDTIYIKTLPWRLEITKERIDVECNWDAINWSCKATISVKAQRSNQTYKALKTAKCELGQGPGIKYYYRFTNDALSWTTLGNPSDGYVVDGAVTIEVEIDVEDFKSLA